jgi:hypothetical protein
MPMKSPHVDFDSCLGGKGNIRGRYFYQYPSLQGSISFSPYLGAFMLFSFLKMYEVLLYDYRAFLLSYREGTW